MPAPQEIDSIKKLGIIAGGGSLPSCLSTVCDTKNIEPVIVGFDGQTEASIMDGRTHLWSSMGSVGKVIKFLKSNDVKDLVLIGAIKRPSLREIKPDLKAAKMLSRIGFSSLGDNGLLSALKKELENEGFTLHGIHKFCDRLFIEEGQLGRYAPLDEDLISINHGLKISQAIGALDIGQSVIVQDGIILGVEGVEGTDALIERCAALQKSGRGGVLVKTCKPQQDKDLDLPTIGVKTVIAAQKAGLSGIAVQAHNVIVVDSNIVAQYADKYNIYVYGYVL